MHSSIFSLLTIQNYCGKITIPKCERRKLKMDDNINEIQQQDVGSMSNDDLKSAVKETMEKIRTQALLLGAQAMCSTILSKITTFEHKQGKITMNDYKRLVKDVKGFCETGLSRNVNFDGTTSEKMEERHVKEVEEPTEN